MTQLARAVLSVSLLLVGACPGGPRGQRGHRPLATPLAPVPAGAWAIEDKQVVAVAPVALDRSRNLLLSDEGLASGCTPPSEEDGPGPEICTPSSFRLVWRDLATGRIVKVLKHGPQRTRGLHDASNGRYSVLEAQGEHLGQPRSEDMSPFANGAREARVFRGSRLLRAFKAAPGERFLCARLVPGKDLVALCVVPETPAGNDFLTLEETYKGLPSWGEVRLVGLATGRLHSKLRYTYQPALRSRPPCSGPVWTPEGWFSSSQDDGDCWAYDKVCHQKRDPGACGRTKGWRDVPREQHIDLAATPDGKGLTVLAFGDLFHYELTPSPVQRGVLARATDRDRDHFLSEPQLTPGDSGRRLVLHGRGRLLRVVTLPRLSVVDVPVTEPFVTRERGGIPSVPAVHLAADDRTLTYAAPDRSLRTLDLQSWSALRRVPREQALGALWTPDPTDPAVAWPWFVHRSQGRLLLVVAGRLLVLHPDTGAAIASLGTHAPLSCLWHPYGCN